MSSSDTAISVRGLSKAYTIAHDQEKHITLAETVLARLKNPLKRPSSETFWALNDVSFDIKKGDVVGIIGRNGAGKSTLLKVLSRITEPTNGEVDIYGRVGSLLEVGTGFHPELTGRENVYLNGAILGMSKDEISRQFDAIVDFAGVEKFLDTPVKRYSSGMYVRLAFAVAAHLPSEILIVDEVLAVGDADFQQKCIGKMQEVRDVGRTILFVSHNMPMMLRLCHKMIMLERGKVVASGDAIPIARQYLLSEQISGRCVRTWPTPADAPGDNVARLKSVRLLNADQIPSETIDIQQPFSIEVEYWCLQNGGMPTVSLNIFNEDKLLLFVTNDFNNLQWKATAREKGIVKSVCTIPANFMAEGRFFVLAAVCSYNPDILHTIEQDAVVFTVFDNSSGDGVRGTYSKNWPGVVRPMFDWRVQAYSQEVTVARSKNCDL